LVSDSKEKKSSQAKPVKQSWNQSISSIKNSQNKINSKSIFYYCQQRFRQVGRRQKTKTEKKKNYFIVL
jgi:hypothetical protein